MGNSLTVKEWIDLSRGMVGLGGLSKQIAETLVRTTSAHAYTDLTPHVEIVGDSAIPYLQRDAGDALIKAIREHGQKPQLIHALRVLPQQYALWRAYAQHRLTIVSAAPGTSPHELGVAIDLQGSPDWIKVLRKYN